MIYFYSIFCPWLLHLLYKCRSEKMSTLISIKEFVVLDFLAALYKTLLISMFGCGGNVILEKFCP